MAKNDSTVRRIRSISVQNLFGTFNYDIPEKTREPLGDITILYGDNGSGKTTILNLIFHLLSPANNKRHRSALFDLPFQLAEIQLTDGAWIRAQRTDGLRGPYQLSVNVPGKGDASGKFSAPSNEGFESKDFMTKFFSLMEELALVVYFLSDDRIISSDSLPRNDDEQSSSAEDVLISGQRVLRTTAVQRSSAAQTRGQMLSRTIDMTQQWISNQVIRGAKEGLGNANAIYLDVVKRIANAAYRSETSSKSLADISGQLAELGVKNAQFARFGFSPDLETTEMIKSLKESPAENRSLIAGILEPFVEGLHARLDGLTTVQRLTDTLVRNLNQFYVNKRVNFDISSGFEFVSSKGIKLQPEWLSSGEQHLLMLFCHTLLSRETSSIFIIDEPELSLNIKWQRMLMNALKELIEGSRNQFILATHSMELLAKHRQNVVQLQSSSQEVQT